MTPSRAQSLCRYLLDGPDLFIVPDTAADPRFSSLPPLLDAPPLRFYAGAPVFADDGQILGGVCVLNDKPHTLSDSQRDSLTVLARITTAYLLSHARGHDSQQLLATLNLLTSTPGPRRGDAATAIAATALDLLGADGVTVLLPDPTRPSLLRGHGTAVRTALPLPSDQLQIDIAIETSAIGIAARRGTALFLADADHSPLTSSRLVAQLNVRSSFYAPFALSATHTGMIAAWWQTPRGPLNTITAHQLNTLAAAAAITFRGHPAEDT